MVSVCAKTEVKSVGRRGSLFGSEAVELLGALTKRVCTFDARVPKERPGLRSRLSIPHALSPVRQSEIVRGMKRDRPLLEGMGVVVV